MEGDEEITKKEDVLIGTNIERRSDCSTEQSTLSSLLAFLPSTPIILGGSAVHMTTLRLVIMDIYNSPHSKIILKRQTGPQQGATRG